MDVVTLPLVQPSTQISFALTLMSNAKRAGVVRHDSLNDRYRLLFSRALRIALDAGMPAVEKVEGGADILILDSATASAFGVDATRPHRTWQEAEKMLDARGVGYALIGQSYSEVMLITRHETYSNNLTGGFVCDGTPTHYFPEPYVGLTQTCPDYPLCSRSDGKIPAIRSL